MNIYQEKILDYYRNPRNHGTIAHPDFTSGEYNPSCGDRVEITGTITHDVLTEALFTGAGCVISQATASMVCEYVQGKTIDEINALTHHDIGMLIGVQLGVLRIKCALLSLHALQQGIAQCEHKKLQKGE